METAMAKRFCLATSLQASPPCSTAPYQQKRPQWRCDSLEFISRRMGTTKARAPTTASLSCKPRRPQ